MALSPAHASPSKGPLLASAALVVAGIVVYANTFSVPFVFDDLLSIPDNPTLRNLWTSLVPLRGQGLTVDGRPLLNLALAVNYAISGPDVWSYHLVNLAIHLAAALVLFLLTRDTLERITGPAREPGENLPPWLPAFAIALLWTVHPLQTESVTYIVQRAESMMGLFYLLTVYGFVRSVSPAARASGAGWLGMSVISCLLGMATKEVTVSAPLLVLLYDRTFVSGSFRAALKSRSRYYGALAATWLFLAALVLHTGARGGTSGFGINVDPFRYTKTQFPAIAHYLWLCFWPHPLIFDYGVRWTHGLGDYLPSAVLLALLAGATAVAVWRRWAAGFLGVWFFAILAPTSSIMPNNRQTLSEHRMYLPLAAVVALVVWAGWTLSSRMGGRKAVLAWFTFLMAAAAALGATAVVRNEDYRSTLALYRDTAEKLPDNSFARFNLGKLLDESGSPIAAMAEYRAAISAAPDMSWAYYNLGNLLLRAGQPAEAAQQYEAALRIDPTYAKAHYNLGVILLSQDRKAEARLQFAEAVRLRPDYLEAHDNLGAVLVDLGHPAEAEVQFQAVLRMNQAIPETHLNFARALLLQGRSAEAIEHIEAALRLRPGFPPAQAMLEQAQSTRRGQLR